MGANARRKTIVANWKMHTTTAEAAQLTNGVVQGLGDEQRVAVIVCPPFPYLALVGELLRNTQVQLGAQNMYPANDGAFTGEVSPTMLLDLNCRYVLVGHSERRHVLGESGEFINNKVRFALAAGLEVILCVGETLAQRNTKHTEAVIDHQLNSGLAHVAEAELLHISIAYEPVWAIGNAEHHATPQQAGEAHAMLRDRFGKLFGETAAQALTIQYGGSVVPANAAAVLSQPGVDGALIGGASLKAEDFLPILSAAVACFHN